MAKVTGPLLSFGASGQIADTLVYGTWKGLKVARSYVVPSNPQTASQTTQRSYLTEAVDQWHTGGSEALEAADKAAWNRYAGVLAPMSGFNAFCRGWINEKVAGGTPPGHFFDVNVNSTTAATFGVDVTGDGLTTEEVSIRLGNSLTFFGVDDDATASSGTATFSSLATGFPAGTRVYFYFEVGTPGTDYMRSGIYTAVLT